MSTFWNTLKLSVGIGMLTFPYAFAQAGVVLAVATLALMGVLTIVAVHGLVGAMRHVMEMTQSQTVSYMDTVGALLGRGWTAATALCLCLGQAGVCIGYEIFICTTFEHYFGVFSYGGWLLLLQLPLLFLSSVRSLRLLGLASCAGMLCLWCGFAAAVALMERKGSSSGWNRMDAFTNLQGYWLYFGVVSLAFEGLAATALTIEQSMAQPEYFTPVLCVAVALVAATECAFGLLGYAAFGSDVEQTITLSFAQDSGWSTAVSVAFSLELLFTFPGNMYPIWKYIEQLSTTSAPYLSTQLLDLAGPSRLRRVAQGTLLRCVAVLAMAFVAHAFQNSFAKFLSLVGSSVCASILFLIPARVQFALVDPWSSSGFMAALLFAVGTLALVVGTASAISG